MLNFNVAELADSTQAAGRGSPEQSNQSTANIQQRSLTGLGSVWKNATSAVLKGWVRQEIVTQFKLAIPIVSIHVCTSLNDK